MTFVPKFHVWFTASACAASNYLKFPTKNRNRIGCIEKKLLFYMFAWAINIMVVIRINPSWRLLYSVHIKKNVFHFVNEFLIDSIDSWIISCSICFCNIDKHKLLFWIYKLFLPFSMELFISKSGIEKNKIHRRKWWPVWFNNIAKTFQKLLSVKMSDVKQDDTQILRNTTALRWMHMDLLLFIWIIPSVTPMTNEYI